MIAMNLLFLFAHQDDEFAVFQTISNAVAAGHKVYCAYLTTGAYSGEPYEHRNQESLAVLRKIGVQDADVLFVGRELNIPDAGLPDRMEMAAEWLDRWLSEHAEIDALYVPAWEGGHHDHDAIHAIGVLVGNRHGLISATNQFPLYNGCGCSGPLFRVLSPLKSNGLVKTASIAWKFRLRFLGYCLSYPSQAKTWLGLFPFVALHYVFFGIEIVQPVSLNRLNQRPHRGALYYERRGFYAWDRMKKKVGELASYVKNNRNFA